MQLKVLGNYQVLNSLLESCIEPGSELVRDGWMGFHLVEICWQKESLIEDSYHVLNY
jgi:hypothetical protein